MYDAADSKCLKYLCLLQNTASTFWTCQVGKQHWTGGHLKGIKPVFLIVLNLLIYLSQGLLLNFFKNLKILPQVLSNEQILHKLFLREPCWSVRRHLSERPSIRKHVHMPIFSCFFFFSHWTTRSSAAAESWFRWRHNSWDKLLRSSWNAEARTDQTMSLVRWYLEF